MSSVELSAPVTGRDIEIATAAPAPRRRFDAYCVRGEAVRPPAILLLPEMFGLTPAMRLSADAFARQGHVVLAPNVFWRAEQAQALGYDGEEREVASARLEGLDIDRAVADIGDAAAALSAQAGTDRVVAVGHCIGGRLAVLALARLRLAGAASYYGLGLSGYPGELRAIAAPVQLHYGLADPHVPLAEIDAVAALVAGSPHVTLYRYPGAAHSFANSKRPMFNPVLAAQVMDRTVALIDEVAARSAQ